MCDGYKASIIIPVYRAEKTLRRCVESILYGTERNVQVILVDDCSPDGSWEICCEIASEDPRVYCIRNDQHQGLAFSINKGIEHAHAKWILFLDGCDWVSGRFVENMVCHAEKYDSAMILCEFAMADAGAEPEEQKSETEIVSFRESVALFRDRLIEQIWNKVFRKDLLLQNGIRIITGNEEVCQFQFVADYCMAAHKKQIVRICDKLYYRTGNDHKRELTCSQITDVFERKKEIVTSVFEGNREGCCAVLSLEKERMVGKVACSGGSCSEKLAAIECLYGKQRALKILKGAERAWHRERAKQVKRVFLYQFVRLRNKLWRGKRNIALAWQRRKLKNDRFSVISQNCIGGVFYHDMRLRFLSPTINLYFDATDFIRFVKNLDRYIALEPEMQWGETYPLGIIDDITVRFMHYDSCSEAKEAWEKRKKRILYDKILIVATDRNGFDQNVFQEWKTISYPKLLFCSKDSYNREDSVYYNEYAKLESVPNLTDRRLFYRDGALIRRINEL